MCILGVVQSTLLGHSSMNRHLVSLACTPLENLYRTCFDTPPHMPLQPVLAVFLLVVCLYCVCCGMQCCVCSC